MPRFGWWTLHNDGAMGTGERTTTTPASHQEDDGDPEDNDARDRNRLDAGFSVG